MFMLIATEREALYLPLFFDGQRDIIYLSTYLRT